jgi:aspartate/methionine/tyrosine aminotransferase
MRMDRFQMERTQCLYENEVKWNISESGVAPLRAIEELLEGEAGRAELLAQALKYPESNGSSLLRERIALFYPGATAQNVLVTTGCSEANYTTLWGLLEKGDRVAVMIPNYMQSWGSPGATPAGRTRRLVERRRGLGSRWALDVASLERAVTKKTKVIMVTNPNNPTGGVLTGEEMGEIVRVARRVGAWIVSDEVYRGAEVGSDTTSPTFWGRYKKVIVTAGLSKAFGLPGLRIGWIVAPPRQTASFWAYQDYTTLTPTMLSDRLARAAWSPGGAKRSWPGRAASSGGTCRRSKTGSGGTATSSSTSGRWPVRSRW